MNIINISASELKNNVANVLNDVYFDKKIALINRYGRIIAKIIPVDKETAGVRSVLDKYFGALPDFPAISKKRNFKKRNVDL